MNRFILTTLAVFMLTACLRDNIDDIPQEQTTSDKIILYSDNAAKGRLLVRMAEGIQTIDIDGIMLDIEPLFPTSAKPSKLDRWHMVRFDEALDLRKVAEAIASNEGVERVEFDTRMKRIASESLPTPASRPEPTRSVEMPFDDPELPWQWHYYNDGSVGDFCEIGADINLINAWRYTTGDNRIIVAVIDGGVMADHPDLADNMWVNEAEKSGVEGVDDDGNGYIDDINGYNYVSNSGLISADAHGTHVAGTISAVNNNGYCGSGIAGGSGNKDGVRIMSLQIFENDEGCFNHQIAQAFRYAADNGAVLCNNSWGYEPGGISSDADYEAYDSLIKNAIDYFAENAGIEGVIDGGISIFAAGNETYPEAVYPGAYYSNICVSAMSPDYTAAFYTNYGPGVNIAAPGGDANYGTIHCISSTSTDLTYGYEYMQGTSMATPHVTGCAALALSYAIKQGYSLTADELRRYILTSVHDINPYQTGNKRCYDYNTGTYYYMSLEPYSKKLGAGYIDAHLLLMQMDSTPCLYFKTGESALLSLDEYFGDGSEALTYDSCEVSSEVSEALGISTTPTIKSGMLSIKCTKPGVGRIKVRAIVGGETVGGGDSMGGMLIEREFELVVRGQVAENGAWL